jgi:hypothetical protein
MPCFDAIYDLFFDMPIKKTLYVYAITSVDDEYIEYYGYDVFKDVFPGTRNVDFSENNNPFASCITFRELDEYVKRKDMTLVQYEFELSNGTVIKTHFGHDDMIIISPTKEQFSFINTLLKSKFEGGFQSELDKHMFVITDLGYDLFPADDLDYYLTNNLFLKEI